MAHRVVIIDDDAQQANLVTEILAGFELTCEVHGQAKTGVAAVVANAPGLVIIDMFLPGVNGAKVAADIRAAHPKVPLIFVSGVYKVAQIASELQPFGAPFISKPFDIEALQRAVANALGIKVAEKAPAEGKGGDAAKAAALPAFTATTGPLSERPLAKLLGEAYRSRVTGVLDLTREKERRKIYLHRGFVRFAASNLRAENAGGMQVAEGTLKEEQLQAAIARAKKDQVPLHTALVSTGALNLGQLELALKRQTEEVVTAAIGWSDGTYAFTALKEPLTVPEAKQHPLTLALLGLKKGLDTAAIRERLEPLGEQRLAGSAELDRELYTVRYLYSGEGVTALLQGTKVSEALEQVKEAELPLLYGLLAFGLASAGTGPLPTAAPDSATKAAIARARQAPKKPKPESATPVSDDLPPLEKIRAEAARHEFASHYHVLHVEQTADVAAIKTAYLTAARRWHADSFAGTPLGDAASTLQAIFARVSEAHQVLSDAAKRAEYDVFLDRLEKGLPTDVGAVLMAEELFLKAEGHYKHKRWAQCEAQLRDAVVLNHAEPDYWAMFGCALVQLRVASRLGEAREAAEKARALQADLPRLRLLDALLLEAGGDRAGAEAALQKLATDKPDFAEGAAELKALQARPTGADKAAADKAGTDKAAEKPAEAEKPAGKLGLLGRLLKRK